MSSRPNISLVEVFPQFIILATLLVAAVIHAVVVRRRCEDDGGGIGNVVGRGDAENADPRDGRLPGGHSSSSSSSRDVVVAVAAVVVEKNRDNRDNDRARANRNYDALISCATTTTAEEEEEDEDGRGRRRRRRGTTTTTTTRDDSERAEEEGGGDDVRSREISVGVGVGGVDDDAPTNTADRRRRRRRSPAPTTMPAESKGRHDAHPGLRGYHEWRTVVASLYRIYAVPSRRGHNNFSPAILPMHPSSERGNVRVYVEATNWSTKHERIDVYWVDHKGNEIYKGSMKNGGGKWNQTTYIGHPWTFRVGPNEEDVLLRYVPFRVVPSIVGAITRHDEGGSSGAQHFALRDVTEGHRRGEATMTTKTTTTREDGCVPVIWVDDRVLPETPLVRVDRSDDDVASTEEDIVDAVAWSCMQIRREDVAHRGNGIASARLLSRYLRNIRDHPNESKYRRLRIGNRTFQRDVYDTGARGVLLALGFEEKYGYMECSSAPDADGVRRMADAIAVVEGTLRIMEGGIDAAVVQPGGGDGYGRAGFGRAGGMNI